MLWSGRKHMLTNKANKMFLIHNQSTINNNNNMLILLFIIKLIHYFFYILFQSVLAAVIWKIPLLYRSCISFVTLALRKAPHINVPKAKWRQNHGEIYILQYKSEQMRLYGLFSCQSKTCNADWSQSSINNLWMHEWMLSYIIHDTDTKQLFKLHLRLLLKE